MLRFLIFSLFLTVFPAIAKDITFPKVENYPDYEMETGRKANDGWGRFSFIISEDGEVEDVILLDKGGDSFNLPNMRKYIEGIEYEPATLNGSAIAAPGLSFQRMIVSSGKPAHFLGENFMGQYQLVIDAIRSKDIDAAISAKQILEEEYTRTFAQQSWLAWVSSMLDYQQGNWSLYSRNLAIGYELSNYNMERRTRTLLHNNYFENLMFNHYYFEALELAYAMTSDDKLAFPEGHLEKMISRARAGVDANNTIVRNIKLLDGTAWTTRLQRNQITVDLVSGVVNKIFYRCFGVNKKWEGEIEFPLVLNEDAPQCLLIIFGEAGTEIKVQDK